MHNTTTFGYWIVEWLEQNSGFLNVFWVSDVVNLKGKSVDESKDLAGIRHAGIRQFVDERTVKNVKNNRSTAGYESRCIFVDKGL